MKQGWGGREEEGGIQTERVWRGWGLGRYGTEGLWWPIVVEGEEGEAMGAYGVEDQRERGSSAGIVIWLVIGRR